MQDLCVFFSPRHDQSPAIISIELYSLVIIATNVFCLMFVQGIALMEARKVCAEKIFI